MCVGFVGFIYIYHMAVLKNEFKDKYSKLPNALIENPNINHPEFRLLCYLNSRPHDWNINNTDIQKKLKIRRRETLAKYWRNLMDLGFISRVKSANQVGQFAGYDYALHIDSPCTVRPCTAQPDTGSTRHGLNSTYTKTNFLTKTNKSNKTEIEVDLILENYKAITGKRIMKPETHYEKIKGILKKFSADEIVNIIQFKFLEWKGDAKMERYITIGTIFSTQNFVKYYEQYNDAKANPNNYKFINQKISAENDTNIKAAIVESID